MLPCCEYTNEFFILCVHESLSSSFFLFALLRCCMNFYSFFHICTRIVLVWKIFVINTYIILVGNRWRPGLGITKGTIWSKRLVNLFSSLFTCSFVCIALNFHNVFDHLSDVPYLNLSGFLQRRAMGNWFCHTRKENLISLLLGNLR